MHQDGRSMISTGVTRVIAAAAALVTALVLSACGSTTAPSDAAPLQTSADQEDRDLAPTAAAEDPVPPTDDENVSAYVESLRATKTDPAREFSPTWGEAVDGFIDTASDAAACDPLTSGACDDLVAFAVGYADEIYLPLAGADVPAGLSSLAAQTAASARALNETSDQTQVQALADLLAQWSQYR